MKKLMLSKAKPYSLEEHKEEVEKVVDLLGKYLETYKPPVARRTAGLAGLLGPVGKVIDRLKVDPKSDPETLVGYGTRVHEMSEAWLSTQSIELLQEGITALTTLLSEVPYTHRHTVLDQIRHRIYYRRKKKDVEERELYLKQLREEWTKYLREKYRSIEATNKAWGSDYETFEKIPLPTSRGIANMKGLLQEDAKAFTKTKKGAKIVEELSEEAVEE